MSDRIRVLIADDQVLFAESLRYVMHGISDTVAVVGIAQDGEEALRLAGTEMPDLILMDVRMPRMDGVEATKLIHLSFPDIRIVMLTTFDDDEYVDLAMKYGAAGYLLKNIRPDALIASVHAVMSGATLFAKDITAKVLKPEYVSLSEARRIVVDLTRREKEVLNLVMQMKNNRQISETLALSDHSVRNYMSALYHAFGVRDRFALINRLKDLRMLDDG